MWHTHFQPLILPPAQCRFIDTTWLVCFGCTARPLKTYISAACQFEAMAGDEDVLLRRQDDEHKSLQRSQQDPEGYTDLHRQHHGMQHALAASQSCSREATDKAEGLATQLTASTAQIGQLSRQLTAMQSQHECMSSEKRSLQEQVQAERLELTARLRHSQSAQADSADDSAASATQVQRLTLQLDVSQQTATELQCSLEAVSQENQHLASQLKTAAANLSGLTSAHSALQMNHSDLMVSHSAMTASLQDMQASYAQLESLHGKLSASHAALEAAQAWLKGSHSELQAETSQLKLQLSEACAFIKQQRMAGDDMATSQLRAAEARIAAQDAQAVALEQANISLQQQLRNLHQSTDQPSWQLQAPDSRCPPRPSHVNLATGFLGAPDTQCQAKLLKANAGAAWPHSTLVMRLMKGDRGPGKSSG